MKTSLYVCMPVCVWECVYNKHLSFILQLLSIVRNPPPFRNPESAATVNRICITAVGRFHWNSRFALALFWPECIFRNVSPLNKAEGSKFLNSTVASHCQDSVSASASAPFRYIQYIRKRSPKSPLDMNANGVGNCKVSSELEVVSAGHSGIGLNVWSSLKCCMRELQCNSA